jgi:tetratricopeptide (TPR) repeat protein
VVLFLGRGEELACFEAVLAGLAGGGDPDEGHVLLVYGLGGIGKSTLLRRYGQIAAEGRAAMGARRLRLAVVDWESEQRLRAADYVPDGGPPIWVVLDRVYRAVRDAVAGRRDTAAVEKAFASFRLQVARVPELAAEVQRALPGADSGRQASAADIDAVLQAVGRGAAVLGVAHPVGALGVPAITGAAHLAHDARVAVRQRRQGPVPEQAYRLILGRVEELADCFARGLQLVSTSIGPVVVLLDTCELISGSQEYLRQAMRRGGSRVLWVAGMRLDPGPVTGAHGQAALYRQEVSESRLRMVPLDRFDDDTVGDYLARKLPAGLPAGLTLKRVTEVTRGIPLAVSLVCDLLRAGQDPELVLQPVPEPGRPSAVIRELAERYLAHAERCVPLQEDVPLLYGLALLHSDRLDPDLLAALWDVDPADVADLITHLAARHDFVLYGSRRLHDDVRDTVRLHLLDDALRAQQRPMNRRAVAHLRDRLANLGLARVDDQVTSQDWQGLATALLWHTFWDDSLAGISLLCHLLPSVHVLAEPFASSLLETAGFFVPVLSTQQQQVIADLAALQPPDPGDEHIQAADSRRGLEVLDRHRADAHPVLAGDIPRVAYLRLLRVKHTERVRDQAASVLAALEQADEALPAPEDPPGISSQALAQLAEQVAQELIFPIRYGDHDWPEALRAATLATRHCPQSARAWWLLALSLMDNYQESLRAAEQAIHLDPGFAQPHNVRGTALAHMGRWQDALAEYDEAIRIDPDFPAAHSNRAGALTRLDRLDEALTACDEAARLRPEDPWAHAHRAHTLRRMGRFGDALAACDNAARLDPEFALASACRGDALRDLGRLQEAADVYHEAIRLKPQDAWLHGQHGECLLLLGQHPAAAASLRKAAELESEDALEARVLLAALLWSKDRAQAAQLATTALEDPGTFTPRFRRAELRAIAHLLIGNPESATAELVSAAAAHAAGDLFQQPLYDLLDDPPVHGLSQITAIWDQITAGAAGESPPDKQSSGIAAKTPS